MLISELLVGKPPDKICLIHGQNSFTYGELEEQSAYLARRLALPAGERVLVDIKEPLSQLAYFFAIVKAGGVCVFLPTGSPSVLSANLSDKHGIKRQITGSFAPGDQGEKVLPKLKSSDIFFGALTSGSTGQAKLLWRDHQSWTSAFPYQSEVFSLSSEDRLFLTGSLSFTANLNSCLHMLFAGGTVVFSSSQMPRRWLADMSEHKTTSIFMVPANYRILLKNMKQPLQTVHSLLSGGAKLDAATVAALQEKFPGAAIREYYGAAELGHVSYAQLPTADPFAVGQPFPEVKINIKEGVIWVSSPYIIPALRPETTVGDLGEIMPGGVLRLFGRGGDVINSGGVKINTAQIEQLLRRHPDVSDIAVLPAADRLRGQKICAVIATANPLLQAKDILSFCRRHLGGKHCPQQVIFLPELPLNNSGKTDRQRLQEFLAKEEIKKLLPQREPFLFLDKLDTETPGIIKGEKSYDSGFIFAQPSRAGDLYVPAAIIIESLAQCGGAGARQLGLASKNIYALAALDKVKIFAQVSLPATVNMKVNTVKAKDKLLAQKGEAWLGDKLIMTAEWKCIAIN